MNRFFLLFTTLLMLVISCKKNNYVKTEDSLIVHLQKATKDAPKTVRLQVITDKIVRVTATMADEFATDTGIMVENKSYPKVQWDIVEAGDTLILSTKSLKAKISLINGAVLFTDTSGNSILNEVKGGKKIFTPIVVDSQKYWSVQQVFDSPDDEAFYGLGQHQNGTINQKGQDVELYQYNSQIAIPFMVSSKNYGLLWNNYSLSRFGDPRDYEPLTIYKMYNWDGWEGGLSASYSEKEDPSKIYMLREDSIIDFEDLTTFKNFPALFQLNEGRVLWTGQIQSDVSGVHKFRVYSAGYIKVWMEGKLVIDRWRQCWNPSPIFISMLMEKGKKYAVRIDWIPDGGESYIGVRSLKPLQGNEQQNQSWFSEVAREIDYYFIKGNTMDDVISGYRYLTGKCPIMPKWAMGFWQSRERYKTQDEILNTMAEFRKRKIPIDNIVQDWFYWQEDKWGDQTFDSSRFANPELMIKQLHERYNAHYMISVWAKFYTTSENFKLLDEKGFLFKQNILDGRKDWVGKGHESTIYDAFNPEARKMFWSFINTNLFSKGVDAWWMDASEPDIHSNLPVETRKELMNPTALGPAALYFNAYPFFNAKGIYEGQREVSPNQRVCILTRSAYAGQQRYAAAVWSGDIGSRWDEMQKQIAVGVNYSMSGLPFWTMDIGGFSVERRYENAQGADLDEWRELNSRWYQFGAFCPLFRAHGQFPLREVYNIAPENHPVYKAILSYDNLRYRLMPYIYTLDAMTYFNDYTIMRGLAMDFGDDMKVLSIKDQYMFGPDIMVCPVTKYLARNREVYLPATNGWYEMNTGKYYEGGQTILADAPLSYIPLFVKAGSVIPVGPVVQYAMEKTKEPLTLMVYTGKDGSFTLYEDENTNYNYEKGAYSMIPFSYSDRINELVIGDRVGSYEGMPLTRQFKVVWVDSNNPQLLNADNLNGTLITYTGTRVSVLRNGGKGK